MNRIEETQTFLNMLQEKLINEKNQFLNAKKFKGFQ
jgi:hypothetical protein